MIIIQLTVKNHEFEVAYSFEIQQEIWKQASLTTRNMMMKDIMNNLTNCASNFLTELENSS